MSKYKLSINGQNFDVEIISENNNSFEVMVNGEILEVEKNKESSTKLNSSNAPKEIVSKESNSKNDSSIAKTQKTKSDPIDSKIKGNSINALMPGKVLKVLVSEGQIVDSDAPLLVIESMKMENVISSSKSGKITKIHVNVDDNVQYDQPLIEIN